MKEQRLNGLASLKMNLDIPISPEEILDVLALDPRKLNLVL